MKPNVLLTVSALYLTLVGLGFLFSPETMLFGAAGATTVTVISTLRGLGGSLLGVAVLNWVGRNAGASKSRDGIFLGNTVGFGLSAITIVLGLVGGGPAAGWIIAVINALFAVAFFVVGRGNMSTSAS